MADFCLARCDPFVIRGVFGGQVQEKLKPTEPTEPADKEDGAGAR